MSGRLAIGEPPEFVEGRRPAASPPPDPPKHQIYSGFPPLFAWAQPATNRPPNSACASGFGCYTAPLTAERCQSGRSGRSRKPLYLHGYREFESHPLRQVVLSLPTSSRYQRRLAVFGGTSARTAVSSQTEGVASGSDFGLRLSGPEQRSHCALSCNPSRRSFARSGREACRSQ